MREIGSEFWETSLPADPKKTVNEAYLLSGRTALKFIIDDVRRNRKFLKILLPAYCCESMIEPFNASGVKVEFYHVSSDCVNYPYDNDADAVLMIDFFGYLNPQNKEIARREKQADKIIIYDATHKLNGNPSVEAYADYSFCSYRKWFYCNYAHVIKHDGVFNCGELKINDHYVKMRDLAAKKKEEYACCLTESKAQFLKLFSKAEKMLDDDYDGYIGTPVVFEINEIESKRRENAMYLIDQLKKNQKIKLWRGSIGLDDIPMFVPILVDPSIRNDLRNFLVSKDIYCPIHWPKSPYHGECNELYDMELSLICDQRYDTSDMNRIVEAINEFFEK